MVNAMPEKGHKQTAFASGPRTVLVELQSQDVGWRHCRPAFRGLPPSFRKGSMEVLRQVSMIR